MNCELDIKKIKQGITEAATVMAKQTELFTIIDNKLFARNPQTLVEPSNLTPEQLQEIEESRKYTDEITNIYRPFFTENPADFLMEIAKQANSTQSEMEGAMNNAGRNLFVLAIKLFPNLGLKTEEEKAVDNINKEFRSEVIQRANSDEWFIHPSNELALEYLAGQSKSADKILEMQREKYLSQFSSTSLNLLSEDLWLNHPILQDPTTQALLKFMKKINPEARVGEFENLDQRAVSLIRDYTIMIRNGQIIDDLPEEVAHFFVEMLPDDNPTKKEMMDNIIDLPIYSETYQKYKDNTAYQKGSRPDIQKIKREAVAKLIGEYIKAAYNNNADENFGKKRSLWKRLIHEFMKFLRRMFNTKTSPRYTEPVVDINNPFYQSAQSIIKGDIDNLNIKKIPSIYDSIFFSQIEDELEEGYEASDIAKALHRSTSAIKNQLVKVYGKYVNDKKYTGLKEQLADPAMKDHNRVWDIIDRLQFAGKQFKDMADSNKFDYSSMIIASQRMAEAYREMEQIPPAISRVVNKMSKDKSEKQLLDNIEELQMYFQFSDAFKKIGDEFVSLITFIRTSYPDATQGLKIYDVIINNMGNAQTQFNVVDEEIMKKLKEHLYNLMVEWTDDYMKEHRTELESRYNTSSTKDIKKKLLQEMEGKFTTAKQLRQAITGSLPQANNLRLGDGSKIDISRLKDTSNKDYAIFLFTSPSLISDPFVSNAFRYFSEKYMEGQFRGSLEAKKFADSIAPTVKQLADLGVDWYELNNKIQNVQSFYDPYTEDNKVEKRVLLSATNRFDFQYQKQSKLNEINKLEREIGDMQKVNSTATPEQIKEKQDKLDTLNTDYDKWLTDYSHRTFTDEFYRKYSLIKEQRTDSSSLKRLKQINRELWDWEQAQYAGIALDETYQNAKYDAVTEKIASLQNEKLRLQETLPETDKKTFELMNELYEEDSVRTARLRHRHKTRWIQDIVATQLNNGSNKTAQELETEAAANYEFLYTIIKPTQRFYDVRNSIFEDINKVSKTATGLEKLSKKVDELREREAKLLKPFRDARTEINVASFKHISIEKHPNGKPKLLSESLKELEQEMDLLNQKIQTYSIVLNSGGLKDQEKDRILSFIDLTSAFTDVFSNRLKYKASDVQNTFKDLIPFTTSQAEQILSSVNKVAQGDMSEFQSLANLQLGDVSPSVRGAYSILKFSSPQEMLEMEYALFTTFKDLTRRERGMMAEQLSTLFSSLNDLYSNGVSLQYYVVLREFFSYYKEYLDNDDFNLADKELHKKKYNTVLGVAPATVSDVENFLGDGVFDAVYEYVGWKERNERNPSSAYPLSELREFWLSLHKQKSNWVDGEMVTTWTPVRYVKQPVTDSSLTEKKSPRFLTINKVKDEYYTKKVYETDQEVIDGIKKPNVDINGEWLPLEKEDSPFWSKEYNDLKTSKKQEDKKAFEILEKTKLQYLQKQQEILPEGERLDLVIPSKGIDKLEQKKFYLTEAKGMFDYVRNSIPFLRSDTDKDSEEENYLEDIKAQTIKNRDIYTGLVISDDKIKLRSMRRISLVRTSKDAISSMAMFFEDINEYSGKALVAPVMKTFMDVFRHTYDLYPHTNKWRASVLEDIYKTKVLDEVPKNMANNTYLAKFLSTINRFVGFRLLGDPIGGIVNLASGEMQILIENSISKDAAVAYAQSGNMARNWLVKYDYDFWNKSNWSKETQMIAMFNMVPDAMDISNHLSTKALLSNVRSKLMAPRSEGEKYMGIHIGLSVLLSEPIVHEGKKVNIDEIYELDPITNIIRLKDEYKSLDKDWNPVTGLKVIAIRRKISQFYTLQQGNFFRQNQSFASTTAIGKTMEVMKRWFASGMVRRFQGRVRDPFTGKERVGYHYAMAQLAGNTISALWDRDMDKVTDYWNNIAKRPSEQAALRRSMAEILYTTVFILLTAYAFGYDDDDEDKNKKVREMAYLKQLALLITMRVQSELGTFIPVPLWGLGYMEMKRAILDPIGLPKMTVDNMMGLGKLAVLQLLDALGIDYDKQLYYQKRKPYGHNVFGLGAFKDKGDSKLLALILNTIGYTGYTFEPAQYIETFTQMQNRIK